MLVVSKCPLAELWTSTVWLVVLVKSELKISEVPWHSTLIVALFLLSNALFSLPLLWLLFTGHLSCPGSCEKQDLQRLCIGILKGESGGVRASCKSVSTGLWIDIGIMQTNLFKSDNKCQCFKDCLIILVFSWADQSLLSIRLLSTLISRKCNKSVGNAVADVPKAENCYVSEAGATVPSHDCLTVVMEKIWRVNCDMLASPGLQATATIQSKLCLRGSVMSGGKAQPLTTPSKSRKSSFPQA